MNQQTAADSLESPRRLLSGTCIVSLRYKFPHLEAVQAATGECALDY